MINANGVSWDMIGVTAGVHKYARRRWDYAVPMSSATNILESELTTSFDLQARGFSPPLSR